MVKTGPIAAGSVVSGGAIAEMALSEGVLTDKRVIIQTTATALAVQACSTPDVAVAMPKQKAGDFTGMGSAGATVGFSLRVNNCPANLNRVRYQFDAPNGVIDAAIGVIALTADSTAGGVGIRITTDAGAALTFGSPGTLTAYSKTTGGSYSIPLKAAYYQTQSAAVTPGKANAALIVTMTYE
ncbi:hypothetical protein RM96_15880 [Cupriavidus sp. IDO]|nr:hypothetical protein RM96_15880 [Cupriavidus sp. IDO]